VAARINVVGADEEVDSGPSVPITATFIRALLDDRNRLGSGTAP